MNTTSTPPNLATWACDLAAENLSEAVPGRWKHDSAAIEKARRFSVVVPDDADLLVAAVALHDIGFAPAAQKSGYSTLDAVWFVQENDAPERLVGLIAHQMASAIEADLRGYGEHWPAFGPDEESPVRDAMWTCCLTTAPDGGEMTPRERLDEMQVRYDADWIGPYVELAGREVEAAERRTRERFEAAHG